MSNEVVRFRLNNWFSGRDYPNEEPFLTWMDKNKFSNDDWCKENKLVVVKSYVDLSQNFCVCASGDWVRENCPKLLSDNFLTYDIIRYSSEGEKTFTYTKPYLHFVDAVGDNDTIEEAGNEPRYGYYMDYKEENFGVHLDRGEDYDLWNHEEEDDE